MAGRTYRTEGIIIKRINYKEADKILTVFTREYGKIIILAKGIRKITSRKKASLELFNRSTLYIARGKAFDIVTEAQTIDFFPQEKISFEKLGRLYYFAEVIDRLVPEKVPEGKIYNLLIGFIKDMVEKTINEIDSNLNSLLKEIVYILGFIDENKKNSNFNVEENIERIVERRINSRRIITN